MRRRADESGRRLPLAALHVVLLVCLGSCLSLPWGRSRPRSPEEVAVWLASARADAEAGRSAEAIEKLRLSRKVEGLSTEMRIEVETLLEEVATARIRELVAREGGQDELEDMVDLDLPGPIAVSAGVTAARKYLDAGRPYKAYRLLRDLEQRYPTHHERRAAGEVLAEAGLRMAGGPDRFLGLFSLRDEGIEALEWLTVTYPSEPRCDEAYFRLAEEYAADRKFVLAVRRYEDLIAYHLQSPLAIEAEARIPRMRLAGLESPEYDRRELNRARVELEAWLEKHPGRALEERVRADYGDCLRRLVLSDIVIARFYQRIDQPFGTRLHAERALDVARLTADEDLVGRCERLLAKARALERESDAREGAQRFLDAPEAELPDEEALKAPVTRENGGGGA